MKKRFIALACAASILGSSALSLPISGHAEEAAEIPVVQMEKSKALAHEPESEITGEIAVIAGEHPIHVNITMYSSEKPVVYYDTDLTASEGSSQTKYVFLVDYSEYPDQAQLAEFQNTYTADYLTGVYSSCYQVTISAPDTDGAVYEEKPVLIADFHADANVKNKTTYTYNVQFSTDQQQPVLYEVPSVNMQDGSADISRNISMLWKPYTLGDVDENDKIDMTDAYLILIYSSYLSLGTTPDMEINTDAADVDENGKIDMTDAYLTLIYTSYLALGNKMTLEEFLASRL